MARSVSQLKLHTRVRECVYPDPALRPASDIDLLIAPGDRRRAARVLLDAGYTVHAEPANISHEATFGRGAAWARDNLP